MARLKPVERSEAPLDPIAQAIEAQPELDDLRAELDQASGLYRQRLKQVADAGVSPAALSFFRRLRRMPSAKALDTWTDLNALVQESGLDRQLELFNEEQRELTRGEPAV